MANDYIPRCDAEFNGWQANFVASGNANLAGLGVVAADLTPIITAQGAWSSAYSAHVAVSAAAQSARQNKDDNRGSLESLIRALVRRLQASPDVSDPERQQLGITVTDAERTPVGPPTSRPVATVDAGERLRHTIEFSDESTPTRKARPALDIRHTECQGPAGVMGAEMIRAAHVSKRLLRSDAPPA